MKSHLRLLRRCIAAAIVIVAVASALSVSAQVIVNDPSLPVVYPGGVYRSLAEPWATFHGAGLTIVLNDVEIRALSPVTRHNSGANEIEDFGSEIFGKVSVNDSPFQNAQGSGPTQVDVFNKVGNVTGTFNTELLSLNLSGTSPFGPFMLRESPTLASTGQTSISDLGGGQYRISGFFDIYTEQSIDGGNSWIPADSSSHNTLVPTPEPSSGALLAVALMSARFLRRRTA